MKNSAFVFCILIALSVASPRALAQADGPIRFSHVNRDKAAVQRLYNEMYLPARNTSEGWKDLGNCNPGTPSPAALKARLTELNYFRKMAGLHPVTLDPAYNRKAQAAAFLMRQNNALSHNPPKTWNCYSAEGAAGAGSCNLGYGGGIFGYITDFGASNQDCGHRMWILKARTQTMGYGGTGSTDAIYVFGDAADYDSLPQYVAWPPAGFIPEEILSERWTFSIPAEYAKYGEATVKVSVNGTSVPLSYTKETGYGDSGLSFEIANWSDWKPKFINQKVKVQIQNVVVGDQSRSFTYEVFAFPATEETVVANNQNDGENEFASNDDANVEEELPFADRKPMTLADFAQAIELPEMTIQKLKYLVARDLVVDAAVSNFATRVSNLRKEKNPDPAKLQAWAEMKIKQHLAHENGMDESEMATALAPKFMLIEFKKLVPMGSETFAEIAREFAAKFAEKPELKAFALKYKRIRQCGVGFAYKRFERNGQTYAGVYATLVLAPKALQAGS